MIDDAPSREVLAAGRFTTRLADQPRHNPNVDAGWWPRSRDLADELPGLLQTALTEEFRPNRVTYRLEDPWTEPPEQISFGGRLIKLSGYHNHHRDMVRLIDGVSHRRLEIMVVPPETDSLVAETALRLAAELADPTSGTAILVMARAAAMIG